MKSFDEREGGAHRVRGCRHDGSNICQGGRLGGDHEITDKTGSQEGVWVFKDLEIFCNELSETEKPTGETAVIFHVCLGAHPAGGDDRAYLLESLENNHVRVWVQVYVEEMEKDLYGLQAQCVNANDLNEKILAKLLMLRIWKEEPRHYGTTFKSLSLDSPGGLLTRDDLLELKGLVKLVEAE